MSDNLPQKYKKTFWITIKNFVVKKIFKRKKDYIYDNFEQISKNNFKEKYEIKSEIIENKDKIFEMIHKNPELLEKLSVKKLEVINKIYDEKIQESKMKISLLERQLKEQSTNI